jgi:hypothetical protein
VSATGAPHDILSTLSAIVAFIKSKLLGASGLPFSVSSSYEDDLQEFPVFTKLYISEHSLGRKIFGVYRDEYISPPQQAVVRYENFDDDICSVVQEYTTRNLNQQPASASGIACVAEGKNYAILMQGSGAAGYLNFNPEAAWEDFTVKLRIS